MAARRRANSRERTQHFAHGPRRTTTTSIFFRTEYILLLLAGTATQIPWRGSALCAWTATDHDDLHFLSNVVHSAAISRTATQIPWRILSSGYVAISTEWMYRGEEEGYEAPL